MFSFRLVVSLLVASSLSSSAAADVNITFAPAELGDFAAGAGCCGYKYEIVVPPTDNAACFENPVTGTGKTECNGTVDFDLSASTRLTMSLMAPEGKEIELRTTGGPSEPDNQSYLGLPISFQGILRYLEGELGGPECGVTQFIKFANITSSISGTLVDGLQLVPNGLPTSWWQTSVEIDNCQISTKVLFAGKNYTTYRFKEISWSVEYDATEAAPGVQTYSYDTAFTYSVVYRSEGSAKVVAEGGDPPTSGASSFVNRVQPSLFAFAVALFILG